jgi:hypothetical protein
MGVGVERSGVVRVGRELAEIAEMVGWEKGRKK